MRNKTVLFPMKICLCALLACTALTSQADITVKVMKGGTAPHLYAWDNSDNPINGNWPGTQMTDKDADGYWTTTISTSLTKINMILNMGGDTHKTDNYVDISGVNGVVKVLYDGDKTMFGTMPEYAYQGGKVAYFASPSTWDGNIYCRIKHNGYEEAHQMTKIGTDGMGLDVYADFNFINWGDTPQQVQFYDMSNHNCNYMNYTLGGYYNAFATYPVATFYNLSAANGFTDAQFRAGIASQLGINDGDVFTPSSVTKLDVSGRGITSLAGINHFAMLIDLNASNNNLNTADLGSNTNLEILNLSKNTNLRGFNSNYSSNSNYINIATSNSNLRELNLADCQIGYFQAINTHYGVSSLERLNLANNTNMSGWSNGIGAQTGLKYLNVTNNGYGSDALKLTNLTHLDTLIADNNPNLNNISTINKASALRYVSLKNCGLTNSISFGNNPALEYIDISNNSATPKNFKLSNNPALKVFKATNAAIKENGLTWDTNSPALDTLIVSGNNAMQYLNTLHRATGLKYLDMSGGDLYLQSMPTFIGSNFPDLEYIDFSNDLISSAKTFDGFAALKNLKLGGNTAIPSITLNNCPAIETIDVTGNTTLTTIGLTNQGYNNSSTLPTITSTNCNALAALNLNNNNYTSVPDVSGIGYTVASLYLNSNALTGIELPSGSPVQFLYAEDNGFNGALELTASSTASLKGLDLGNNGITSFKAEGTTLSALMLGNNASMTTLELHGNDNLTCTTAGTTMSDGSGLYIKGNTALETIDLSNSSFNQIGANAAFQGLTAVKTLNGSHNKFTTFTNSNYDIIDGHGNNRYTSYVAGKSSLEHLTGLVHLDLSYNEIADSVHLYRNTALEYLDVSHNNKLGPLATTDAEKLAMRLRKADLLRKYHNKSTPIGVSCTPATQAILTANETECKQPGRPFDYRDKDLRDTTGLFHLDLNYNVNLKYLDISNTNIHNTAAGWTYMCPGWEVGTGGWYSTTTQTQANTQRSPANGSTRHHFVWLQTCGKLEEFHADNNSMQSLGVSTSPYLHTITASGMHGDCYFMRDYKAIGNGNITITGSIAVYDHTDFSFNQQGELTGVIYYRDASGAIGEKANLTNFFPNPVKWYDVSNSDFYIVRTANGADLEHLDVSGNHLSELKVSGNTKLQYVDTENNDLLTYVDANDLPDLTTLKVADNPVLEKLYADNDPSLPSITGLDDCSALKYLHVQNNGLFGSNGFNVEANTNLQSLLAYNCNLPGELKVSQCAALDTLCCNDNQLTKLDVASLEQMHWLDCYNNTGITVLEPSASTGMTHLDLHNCSVLDLDVAPNTAMCYFDCDNNHIRELDFAGATGVETIHANSNNLFKLNLTGTHPALADLQFEHNHINGIDLTGCDANVLTTVNDADNGRTIRANMNRVNGKELYFFQLQQLSDGSYYLSDEGCTEDAAAPYGRNYTETMQPRSLVQDGFDSSRATWIEKIDGNLRARSDGYNLDPDYVMGSIVILENTSTDPSMGSGTEVYQYDNGVSTSEFYLNWTATNSIVTETEDINATELTVTGGTGSITISTPQAMTFTIYDMSGRIIDQRNVEPGTTVIDGLQPGFYIAGGQKVAVK